MSMNLKSEAGTDLTNSIDFPLVGGYRSHDELAAMSIRELRRMSSQRGLRGGARMRKDRLVDALFEQQQPYVSGGSNGSNGSNGHDGSAMHTDSAVGDSTSTADDGASQD
ncbi:MAG: Rho termination factor N-terminal domain-containing protein [Acidimicrobiia bacterium]